MRFVLIKYDLIFFDLRGFGRKDEYTIVAKKISFLPIRDFSSSYLIPWKNITILLSSIEKLKQKLRNRKDGKILEYIFSYYKYQDYFT